MHNRSRLLLLATTNTDKVREYRGLLKGVPFRLVTPADVGLDLDVAETGTTFQENAMLKAEAFSKASGLLALSDDSGLEVAALNGKPGVRTARYAGPNKTNEERNAFLLAKLKHVPMSKRQAQFRCAIVIAEPGGKLHVCEGQVDGLIAMAPAGDRGWGYDPVFYLPALGKTLGELPPWRKKQLSHRGRAARKAVRVLKRLYSQATKPTEPVDKVDIALHERQNLKDASHTNR